ncbi:alpha/beta fold hydrolase [uncultured Zobellia sp.]|uniref:alpha/beta hydrolase family protein n=1 Tax=uncultured Zobellia sp. TaxID=255433 RepID=UPI0025965060|nr:alpha/beta fold hydrolase [uncultured Zobellia sp.]
MKAIQLLIFTILLTWSSNAQDITGEWNGAIKVAGTQLRLVINITQTDSGYASTMDSPDQGAKDIPVSLTTFKDSVLNFEVSSIKATYSGTLTKDGTIDGTFTQAGHELPLVFSKEEVDELVRPQEPKKPYPYYSEEVSFANAKDSITLSGTLTLPDKNGKNPVVVLISGSGPQDRNQTILGHKPFLVITDYLAKRGIGVLRYDDRGTYKSSGNFSAATSRDFTNDVLSAVAYLKTRNDIDPKNIGLIGHSEGGLIAPMAAVDSNDVAFIVLLAGPGLSGYDIILLQTELIAKTNGMDGTRLKTELDILKGALDVVVSGENLNETKTDLTHFYQRGLQDHPEILPPGMTRDDYVKHTVLQLANPWFQYFLKYEPSTSLVKVKCPILALNGEKDLQVPSKINLDSIAKYVTDGGNHQVTVKELPGLNHLFQECSTGSPNEYSFISQTFSPIALSEISQWVKEQIK